MTNKMTITINLNYILCLLLFLSNFANCAVIKTDSSDLDYTDCGSTSYISDLHISNCTESPCTLYIGQNHSVSFNLTTDQETGSLQNSISVIVRGTAFDLSVTPEPCDAFTCPLKMGYKTTYTATLTIPEVLLPMRADLRWIITDQSQNQLICFETSVVLLFP